MDETLVVHGRYSGQTFIPDGELPVAEGVAELVIHPVVTRAVGSVANAFGAGRVLRSAEDILAQVQASRDEWGQS